jgi:hypothetical protein
LHYFILQISFPTNGGVTASFLSLFDNWIGSFWKSLSVTGASRRSSFGIQCSTGDAAFSRREPVLSSVGLVEGNMITQRLLIFAAILGLLAPGAFAQNVPVGTVVPIMLTMTLDSSKARPGDRVTGKIMEDVPLPTGERIPEGSKVFGHVAEVQTQNGDSPALLSLQFDKIVFHGHEVAVRTNVRALASMMAVSEAQVPLFEPDTTPKSAVMLAPVGGEAAFRPDNPEKSRGFVRFSGDLAPGCGGRIDRDGGTGALWVFSPYACGVYGFGKGLIIVSDGSAEPAGSIVLASQKVVSVHAGSGWLLRVESKSAESERIRE